MKLAINESGLLDLNFGDQGLEQETTLESAVLLSLLTNRRADPDDALPFEDNNATPISPDRQGWVGDVLDEKGRLVGSRLWLLVRKLQTEETRKLAIRYAHEALQYFVDDGYATAIEVDAKWSGIGRVEITGRLILADGTPFSFAAHKAYGGTYAL